MALYGVSILPAAFNFGHIVKPNTSASRSVFILSSISALIHFEREYFICFKPSVTIILFSPVNLIQSATVHMAAISIDSLK
jgi:low affinity Fe/Cu permease